MNYSTMVPLPLNPTTAIISYPDFSNMEGLVLSGVATQDTNALQLVSGDFERGTAWAETQVMIDQDAMYEVNFAFSITDHADNPADLFCFLIHERNVTEENVVFDTYGQSYLTTPTTPMRINVEFNTFQNAGDPVTPFVRISVTGSSVYVESDDAMAYVPQIIDGEIHMVKIDKDPVTRKIRLFLDDMVNPLITAKYHPFGVNPVEGYFQYPGTMGFTASTSNLFQRVKVHTFVVHGWPVIEEAALDLGSNRNSFVRQRDDDLQVTYWKRRSLHQGSSLKQLTFMDKAELANSYRSRIKDCDFNALPEEDYALIVENCVDVVIEDCKFVTDSGGLLLRNCEDVFIKNIHVTGGTTGIRLEECKGVNIEDVLIENTGIGLDIPNVTTESFFSSISFKNVTTAIKEHGLFNSYESCHFDNVTNPMDIETPQHIRIFNMPGISPEKYKVGIFYPNSGQYTVYENVERIKFSSNIIKAIEQVNGVRFHGSSALIDEVFVATTGVSSLLNLTKSYAGDVIVILEGVKVSPENYTRVGQDLTLNVETTAGQEVRVIGLPAGL